MSTKVGRRTVEELLEDGERRLETKGVEFPDASAVWLLAHALGVEDPDDLDDRAAEPVARTAESRFWKLVARRERHEPFQYIVGLADFRDALMEVTHGVFLPRLQSERMCDEIEEWARSRDAPRDGWRIAHTGYRRTFEQSYSLEDLPSMKIGGPGTATYAATE